jgi:hypothetical protein
VIPVNVPKPLADVVNALGWQEVPREDRDPFRMFYSPGLTHRLFVYAIGPERFCFSWYDLDGPHLHTGDGSLAMKWLSALLR